jgi:Aspartate oxidase
MAAEFVASNARHCVQWLIDQGVLFDTQVQPNGEESYHLTREGGHSHRRILHDFLLLQKIGRYVDEPLKARVISELRPTTRAPSEKMTGKPSKKALAKRAEKKEKEKEKPRVKQRHRDTKNIGKRRKPSAAAPETKTEE